MSAQKVDVHREIAIEHAQRANYIRDNCKPSARKSYGSYKPVIVSPGYPSNRTEVVGTRAETRYKVWVDGRPDPKTAYMHFERGKTFATRSEAVDYASEVIKRRVMRAEDQAQAALAKVKGETA